MRLIDADNPKLRVALYTYTRFSGIYEAPDEHADQELDLAPTVEERKEGKWIPCSERLPSEPEAVIVTWVNHNPPVYYKHIKDVPKADTAVYYKGAWYWWDEQVIDLLDEHDGAYIHSIEPIDKDIEVTAWMPLPEPYKEEDDEDD